MVYQRQAVQDFFKFRPCDTSSKSTKHQTLGIGIEREKREERREKREERREREREKSAQTKFSFYISYNNGINNKVLGVLSKNTPLPTTYCVMTSYRME